MILREFLSACCVLPLHCGSTHVCYTHFFFPVELKMFKKSIHLSDQRWSENGTSTKEMLVLKTWRVLRQCRLHVISSQMRDHDFAEKRQNWRDDGCAHQWQAFQDVVITRFRGCVHSRHLWVAVPIPWGEEQCSAHSFTSAANWETFLQKNTVNLLAS